MYFIYSFYPSEYLALIYIAQIRPEFLFFCIRSLGSKGYHISRKMAMGEILPQGNKHRVDLALPQFLQARLDENVYCSAGVRGEAGVRSINARRNGPGMVAIIAFRKHRHTKLRHFVRVRVSPARRLLSQQ